MYICIINTANVYKNYILMKLLQNDITTNSSKLLINILPVMISIENMGNVLLVGITQYALHKTLKIFKS